MDIRFSTLPEQHRNTIMTGIQNLRDRSRRERDRCLSRKMTPVVANVWDKCLAKITADILADNLTDQSIDHMISTEIVDFMDDEICKALGRG